MSLKKKSANVSSSFKNIFVTSNGKVKNSPIKNMNGLTLKELHRNDDELDPKLKEDLKIMIDIIEDIKKKKYSNKSMDNEEFCSYLKTNLTKRKMKKLFEVLLLKKKYSDDKTMLELCEELRIHRPDLMRPRVLNLFLAIINTVLSKTSIMILLMISCPILDYNKFTLQSGFFLYLLLRQGSYFMPKGFRLGNRIRARHSARKIIGDTRKNKNKELE